MARPLKGDEPSETTTPPPKRARTGGLQAGECIAGRYELVSKLGQGGSGEVWKAVHRRLGINVAVKTPLVRDSETLERFRREAQALCLIDSEHVLRCFEYGEKPFPFLVMELLNGESLADRLEREGPMPLATVKKICSQLCKGLQAVHRIGVVHRDIKPSNIYCIEDRFKIVDFGLMKLVSSTQDPATKLLVTGHDELTRANAFMGTLSYMSPEQLEHANRVDFRSDLWSLGVVLYRLLTAQHPFAAKADYQICLNIAEQPHPRITELNPELSPEAEVFFQVALAKDPARRFGSAAQFAEAFASIPELGASPILHLVDVIRMPAHAVAGLPPSYISPSTKVRLEEMSTVPVSSGRPSTRSSRSVEVHASASEKRLGVAVKAPSVHTEGPGAQQSDDADLRLMNPLVDRDTESSLSVSGDRPSWIGGPTRSTLASAVALAVLLGCGGFGLFALSKSGCDESTRDCDGNLLNGCETPITTVEHCGACGLSCTNPNGTTTCTNGTCAPVCAERYADCDGSAENGCETSTASSIENCGACHVRCAGEHGTPTCEGGTCSLECDLGYKHSDDDPGNGCEPDLRIDIEHRSPQ